MDLNNMAGVIERLQSKAPLHEIIRGDGGLFKEKIQVIFCPLFVAPIFSAVFCSHFLMHDEHGSLGCSNTIESQISIIL